MERKKEKVILLCFFVLLFVCCGLRHCWLICGWSEWFTCCVCVYETVVFVVICLCCFGFEIVSWFVRLLVLRLCCGCWCVFLCFLWLFCRLIVAAFGVLEKMLWVLASSLCCPIGCIYKRGTLATKGVSLGHQVFGTWVTACVGLVWTKK